MDELLRARVRSPAKRAEVWAVLRAREPSHAQRLWMAGFLKFCGLSVEEAAGLVGRCCAWADYDAATTWRQLCSVWGVKSPPPPAAPTPETVPARPRPATFWRRVPLFPEWFCEGARECWIEVERATGRVARYRSVEGEDHTLLFVDLDARNGDLGAAWEAARALWAVGPWWLLKFSGSRGFHVVARLPGAVAPAELRALARRRVEAAGVDPTLVDWSIYTRRRLIRCVGSLHLGSGLWSVVVEPDFELWSCQRCSRVQECKCKWLLMVQSHRERSLALPRPPTPTEVARVEPTAQIHHSRSQASSGDESLRNSEDNDLQTMTVRYRVFGP